MTALRFLFIAWVLFMTGVGLGRHDYGLGLELGITLAAWLVAALAAFPPPKPVDKARRNRRHAAAGELREWSRIVMDDDFDPAELPAGALHVSLEEAATMLEADR